MKKADINAHDLLVKLREAVEKLESKKELACVLEEVDRFLNIRETKTKLVRRDIGA